MKPKPNESPAPNATPSPFIGMFTEETNTWISSDYCSDWKLHEAIREILQNQMDGMSMKAEGGKKYIDKKAYENGYDFDFIHSKKNEKLGEIRYNKDNKVLTIWNYGTLETADPLLGGIKGKSENVEIIGRFGEGMKLAALAFCRLGKIFIIVTGGEEWRFDIKEDKNFTRNRQIQKCLFWWKANNSEEEYKNKIVVIIRNIEMDEWKNEIDNYLYLTKKKKGEITAYDKDNTNVLGQILLGDDFRNKIFVKDIFVTNTKKKDEKENHITNCFYGFNTALQLDRDRNCVPDLNERNQKTSKIIAYILNNRTILYNKTESYIHKYLDNFPKEILSLLAKNYGVTYYLHDNLTLEGANLIWNEWKKNRPCYVDNEKNIKKFIFDKKLNDDFYPYVTDISWQQWHCLKRSGNYLPIDKKFNNLISNSKEEKNIPEKYINALKDICDKMKLMIPNFTQELIKFKKYTTPVDKEFSYIENGIIYFSYDLFNLEPDLNWKIKILAKCCQMKGIVAQKIIEVFGLIK